MTSASREWDWPQGIGLYGLLKIAKIQDSEEYRTFLHDWFKENIAQGLPSRNINTTTPLLTLCELKRFTTTLSLKPFVWIGQSG